MRSPSTTSATSVPYRATSLEVAMHWIDGDWVESDTVSDSINHATGEVLGVWADGGEAEARAAVAAARRAFDTTPWSRDRNLRNQALNEMAEAFDAHAEELGPLVTKENGKKLAEGMLEAALPGITLRHITGQALTDSGITAEVAPGQWFSTYGEPAGVVGVIVPWNSPVVLLIRSLASPILRGGPVTDGALAAGAFYRPALLEVEDVNTEIVQKEVFGPVATFEVFDSEVDAVVRGNATEMGLSAGIFTNDINTSRRVSREPQAGTVWTNTWAAINDGFAEGGYKQSGIGRLRGPLAIAGFQEAKTVVHAIPPLQA